MALAPPTISPTDEFVSVPNCILRALDTICVDLFLQHDVMEPPVLYRDAGYPLSRDRANGLADECHDALFVRSRDYMEFSKAFVKSLEDCLELDRLPATERYELLQCAVSLEIEQSLCMMNSNTYVAQTQSIGRQIARLVNENQVLPADLFDIVRHDHHTFVHVTNVAGYVTLLAKELGISDPNELEQLAIGGLLHDLGKRHIPRSILNKTEPLTPDEWDTIQEHPQRGYEELCQREDLVDGQLMMTYQHHEHLNGQGYPVGIMGDEIHPWAKMLAVVDVFDALTGNRPYRNPMSCNETLDFLS
ncbi:MAG: HD domain-containing phosphohydrolase, partial [Lacipirellulaceae bacterium]